MTPIRIAGSTGSISRRGGLPARTCVSTNVTPQTSTSMTTSPGPGVTGATSVNIAINVIQITALVVFSVIAIAYRVNHAEGSKGITLNPDGVPVSKVIAMTTRTPYPSARRNATLPSRLTIDGARDDLPLVTNEILEEAKLPRLQRDRLIGPFGSAPSHIELQVRDS